MRLGRVWVLAVLLVPACSSPPPLTKPFVGPPGSTVLRVPETEPTIQAAIDHAKPGDIVLVAPGSYPGRVAVPNKAITLASWYLASGNPAHIKATHLISRGPGIIVKGPSQAGEAVAEVRIVGFTIYHSKTGISVEEGSAVIEHNILRSNAREGIAFESGHGVVRGNTIEGNKDDGIDCDGATSVLVEDNQILENGDDGIEIRFHPYEGPLLEYQIRGNVFDGNQEDGIQLIGYPSTSTRRVQIERNLIRNSAKVGVGLMANAETVENFEGAPIEEPIFIVQNTFVDNPYAITGGNNTLILNNIIVGSEVGISHLRDRSRASNNLVWHTPVPAQDWPPGLPEPVERDPRLTDDFHLDANSPAIDAGLASYQHDGVSVLPVGPYHGSAPDLGAFEH